MAERRKSIRYRLNAPVIFRWKGPDKERFQGEGVTRDMSITGAFIVTATCPPPNAVVKMEVLLPLSDGASKAQMRADMTVLRVDHDLAGSTRSGFSAVGKGFLLNTFTERTSRTVADLIKSSEEPEPEQD
jgi:PilZ domain-containing protein